MGRAGKCCKSERDEMVRPNQYFLLLLLNMLTKYLDLSIKSVSKNVEMIKVAERLNVIEKICA